MAERKRRRLNFEGMDPNQGAIALLRYLYESQEEQHERLERLERYFAALYEMVYQMHSGGPRGATPNPQQQEAAQQVDPETPAVVKEFGREAGRAANWNW